MEFTVPSALVIARGVIGGLPYLKLETRNNDKTVSHYTVLIYNLEPRTRSEIHVGTFVSVRFRRISAGSSLIEALWISPLKNYVTAPDYPRHQESFCKELGDTNSSMEFTVPSALVIARGVIGGLPYLKLETRNNNKTISHYTILIYNLEPRTRSKIHIGTFVSARFRRLPADSSLIEAMWISPLKNYVTAPHYPRHQESFCKELGDTVCATYDISCAARSVHQSDNSIPFKTHVESKIERDESTRKYISLEERGERKEIRKQNRRGRNSLQKYRRRQHLHRKIKKIPKKIMEDKKKINTVQPTLEAAQVTETLPTPPLKEKEVSTQAINTRNKFCTYDVDDDSDYDDWITF